MTRRLTDLQLERYLAEALPAAERSSVEKVLSESPPDSEALRLLQASTAALFVTQPPAAFVEKVMPPKKSAWRGWLGALSAIAAAAALLLVIRTQQDDPETLVKGGVGWHVTATNQHGTRTLSEQTPVAPGETLSFEVASDRRVYVAVVSHAPDGWWVYAPVKGSEALRVERGLTVIPDGAQLDETVGNETLYLLSSDEPFEPTRIRDALKNGFTPPGLTMEPMAIVKQKR
ncbi:MAG: hypothetical protein Q8L48_09620 [Archangium sp.]|nr:hypothetical protein [Archangium sp.]